MKRSETIRNQLIEEIEDSDVPIKKGRRVAVRVGASYLSQSEKQDDVDFSEMIIFVRKAYLSKVVDGKNFRDVFFPKAKESIVENYFGIGFEEYVPYIPESTDEVTGIVFTKALLDGEIYGYIFRNHDEKITWRKEKETEEKML